MKALKKWTFLIIGFLLIAPTLPKVSAAEEKTVRVYFIGNSVTDTVRYGSLKKLAESRGIKMVWGRTMIPGAPLEWIYTHPDDGFREQPFGTWKSALKDYPWDVVVLQPFDRHLHSKNQAGEDFGDVALITKFAKMAYEKNPDVQIYIYARWPRVTVNGKGVPFDKNDYDPTKPGSGNDLSKIDPYKIRWEAKYTGGWDLTNESRGYFETLLREVRKETVFLKKPVLLVPVGYVFAELDDWMKNGKVKGYSNIYQLYKDGIHLNETGSYIVGCTFFATLFKESPEGLSVEPYGNVDRELATTAQKLIWQVVKSNPFSGIEK
ncbi:MAG: hypothetical protein ACP5T0_03330 [Verrucomicrobiia bacterium]